MAFVLSPSVASTPQFDVPYGSPICSRSCSSTSDVGTVRRLTIRNVTPASFNSISRPPLGVIASRKENSPLNGSAGSLLNFRLYEGLSADVSPRRSWSWNVPGDYPERLRQSPAPSRFQTDSESRPSTSLRTQSPEYNSIEDLGHISLFHHADSSDDSADDGDEVEHDDDERFTTPLESPTAHSAPKSTIDFPNFDGVECIDFQENIVQEDTQIHVPEDGRSSPFKRWLRTLRKRNAPEPELLKPPEERWVMDNFDPHSLVTPQRPLRPHLGHRKTASSVSSSGLLSAVKTASVTIASLSLYPRSRRSTRNSYILSENSHLDLTYGRTSMDSVPESTPLMDDGTWFRSVRRNRIVEEVVTSEESYIRDLKTLINVVLPILLYFSAEYFDRSTSRCSRGMPMIVKSFTDQSLNYFSYMKSF
jgi:hypothetical protein